MSNCNCIIGAYFDNSDNSCKACPNSCLNCTISNCLTCAENRIYSGSGRTCVCTGITGYYDSGALACP